MNNKKNSFQDRLRVCVDRQIAYNSQKNIFYNKFDDYLQLAKSTKDFIRENKNEIVDFFQGSSDSVIEDELRLMVRKVIYNLSITNQYINIREDDLLVLKKHYHSLMKKIVVELLGEARDEVLDDIIREHYENLKNWLRESNPFIEEINKDNKEAASTVCGEYSPETQLQVLGLEVEKMIEPVLDIGCGAEAGLVFFLRNFGYEVYGLDRVIKTKADYLFEANWLEFEYGINKWGTIISHLGFSNHFIHHHHRKDGSFEEYAHKYMEILNSLKVGGVFYYSPSLEFVEEHLDSRSYLLERRTNLVYGEDIQTTASYVKRLS